MRLAALMCVGAGEADRYLRRCIRAAREWADLIIVYGDGPDAATRDLIATYAHVGRIEGESLHARGEHLVRNRLFELADEHLNAGDMVVVIDADEQIHASADTVRGSLRLAALSPQDSWNVHFLHLWNPEGTMHRVDGQWQPSVGTRVYRHQPGLRVAPYGGAWVCPPLPQHLMRPGPPIFDVLHWSYARPEDREPKHRLYTQRLGHSIGHVNSILTEPTLAPVR